MEGKYVFSQKTVQSDPSNSTFSAVPIQCTSGYAYQSFDGGDCEGVSPEQDFNGMPGIGWRFAGGASANGMTGPDTLFNPPPFTEPGFSQAALLQGQNAISQAVDGFVPGENYMLRFYLGSRYASECCDGNQTVVVTVDNKPIGVWKLVSYTPFTLRTVTFSVTHTGSHVLGFAGVKRRTEVRRCTLKRAPHGSSRRGRVTMSCITGRSSL